MFPFTAYFVQISGLLIKPLMALLPLILLLNDNNDNNSNNFSSGIKKFKATLYYKKSKKMLKNKLRRDRKKKRF